MKKTLIVLLAILVFPSLSIGANYSYLKKANPNELQVWLFTDNRSDLSKEELQEVVFATIRRARIKPIPYDFTLARGEIYLEVEISGNFNRTSVNPFQVLVSFSTRTDKYGFIKTSCSEGSFGMRKTDMVIDNIKRNVEKILDHYLKVNFDL